MNADWLAAIGGAVMSLAFSYVPGLRAWYGTLDGTRKRLVMLVVLLVTAAGAYALACFGVADDFGLALTCDRQGGVLMVRAFLMALMSNQATYLVSPQGEAG